jgi:ubiquitin carboxyl-terminal hydrolase 4/11/15
LKLSCGAENGSGGAFQLVPTIDIKYDEENVQSARDQGKLSPDVVIPRSEIDSEETRGPKFVDCSVFELLLLTMGSTEYFYNDSLPLKLKERQTIICLWPQKHYDYYFNHMTPEIPLEIDESCHYRQKSEKKDVPELTLERCLETFAEEEQLSTQDTWYCPECKEHVQAYKKFSISKVPKLLLIHLKRFSYRGQHRERIDDVVKFPITDFDISKFVDEPHTSTMKYDLFAVSNHYGTMGGGHYTAFVRKRNDTTSWIKCDDSHVSNVSSQSIITEAAYVLFYVRKDVEWPQFDETRLNEAKVEKEVELNDDADYEAESGEYEDDDGEKNPDKTVSSTNANNENSDQ